MGVLGQGGVCEGRNKVPLGSRLWVLAFMVRVSREVEGRGESRLGLGGQTRR